MASNFLPVGLLDQPWSEDDSLGTLSSLERRQRKAAEKSDINAFYKFLGIVFLTLNLVILGSELYTFATEPSRGLTGAFFLEIGRLLGVAYSQLQNLYKVVGDIAWTGIAVVHGHDFAQRGVDIAKGVAELLASGLFYLALALTVLIHFYACYGIWRTPLRTIVFSAVATPLLIGTPWLYEWLVRRLCKTQSAEPVVLWALLFGGIMCFASLLVARTVGGRLGEGSQSMVSPTRHRGTAALRRQPAAGGGASVSSAGGGSGSGHRRGLYNRASSSGRSGAAALGDATQPSVARSSSSASLASSGLFPGFPCLSGAASGGAAVDPVGIHASARGLHRAGSVGSNFTDATSSPSVGQTKHGAAPGASGGMPNSRGGLTSHPSALDPVGVTSKMNGSSGSRVVGPGGSACPSTSNNSSTHSVSAIAKGSNSSSSSVKQRQQPGGPCSGGSGSSGGDGISKTKLTGWTGTGAGSTANETRSGAQDLILARARAGGNIKQSTGAHVSNLKQHESITSSQVITAATAFATAGNPSSSSLVTAAATSTSKKKAPNISGSNSNTTGASASSHTPALRHQHGVLHATTASAPGSASPAAGSANRPTRSDMTGSKPSSKEPAGPVAAVAPAGGGLFSRFTASVASSAAAITPAMAIRTAKKATGPAPAVTPAAAARKPQGQQTLPPQPLPPPPPMQYVFVQPPPPPPPRRTQAPVAVSHAPTSTAVAAEGVASPAACHNTRNAWLNPNPVIKQASVVSRGHKDAPATVRTPTAAAAAMADFPTSRSTGGAAPHLTASPSTRSASCGGAGSAGVSPVDPPVFEGSPQTYTRSPVYAGAAASFTDATVRSSVTTTGPDAVAALPAVGVPASAFLQPQAQEHLRTHLQVNLSCPETLISTTIVSSDSSIGSLVAHKHASGDLDIANVAANYRPYPSAVVSPAVTTAVTANTETGDSFSLFSTPPPLITADSAMNTIAGLDGGQAPRSGGGALHLQYGNHGVYGNYTALPSLVNDPVWGHNVPSIYGAPPLFHGPQAPRAPPPGFPSHAYGGAFAAGPISSTTGWEQLPTTAGSNDRSDNLPLPPAAEKGILASLGFVDDVSADGASGGGGDDAGGSCAICWSAPRQVGFLHGKTSHLCVCRRCAAKLREGVHSCPMCRQLIERIIDIY
ncbi:hypothetical protein VaNZ11_012701 [Volvox africanus]|uniref:RING-type domain-containing protein n=1 Tax=Volvox africanus TaxID=51714 RepID=A0ABQ5SGB8_9CHLO|nr:hypothetical protein VaNZ11_012701 [Volvox africanus]